MMSTTQLYLLGLALLVGGAFSSTKLSQAQVQERSNRSWYSHDVRYVAVKDTPKKVTGFRSAFQWTIGETVTNSGILNSIDFEVDDTLIPKLKFSGSIGLDSNGPTNGVHFWMIGAESSAAGAYFTCSNYFAYMDVQGACLNDNYNLINNAIYFLDVEIEGNLVRGYISEPQKDLNDMDDSNLTRHLIGAFKWSNVVENLRPVNYFNMNHADTFSSYKMSNEITTVNYAPQVYNNEMRQETSLSYEGFNFWPQNTILTLTSDKKIAVYLSRPSPLIN